MLVKVSGNACTRDLTLVHAQVEAVRSGHLAADPHGGSRQFSQLHALGVGQLRVVGHVTVRAHQQVA